MPSLSQKTKIKRMKCLRMSHMCFRNLFLIKKKDIEKEGKNKSAKEEWDMSNRESMPIWKMRRPYKS